MSVGKRGVHANLGIPGTGLSFRERISSGTQSEPAAPSVATSEVSPIPGWLRTIAAGFGILSLISAGSSSLGWAAVFLVACVGTVWFRARWITEERQYRREKEAEAQAKRDEAHKARIEYLMNRNGGDAALVARIDAGELWVGQTADQLRDSYGEPEDVEEKVMKTRHREVWKYDQTGTNRYSTKITLDDGAVVGWDKRD